MNPVYRSRVLGTAIDNATRFTVEFLAYLPENVLVYEAFEREALKVVAKGYAHYSARTIIEVLRHHNALAEHAGPWKLNDWHTPYLARLFALMHPAHRELFEFRMVKAARRGAAANDEGWATA